MINQFVHINDQKLTVREEDHHTSPQHVFNLPSLLDTFGDNHGTTALGCGRVLGGQTGRLNLITGCCSAAAEDFVYKERRGEWRFYRKVCNAHTIGDIRRDRFRVFLDIMDDCLVAGESSERVHPEERAH